MKLLNLTIAAAALFAVLHAGPLQAQDIKAGTLEIKQPWARATPKGAQVGGGYFSVTNTGKTADRLVGGSSEVSGKFEIHSMTMDNGVMRMRPVAGGLEIKPGETLVLKPGGYHIMFMDLKKPLTKGATIQGHPGVREGRPGRGSICGPGARREAARRDGRSIDEDEALIVASSEL